MTAAAPPVWTVISAVGSVVLFTIWNCCPFTKVVVTGNLTVCKLIPVKNCKNVLETDRVVIPPVVAVVVYPGIKLLIRVLMLASRDITVLAVALLVNAVHVGLAPTPPLVNTLPVATSAKLANAVVPLPSRIAPAVNVV